MIRVRASTLLAAATWTCGIVLFAVPAFAGTAGNALELHPPDWLRDGEPTPDARRLDPEIRRGAPPIDERSIVLDLDRLGAELRRRAGHDFISGVVEPTDGPSVYDFSGIPCLAYRYVMGYYKQAFEDELLQHWITGMTPMQLDRAGNWFQNGLADARNGQWWNRTWRESLVPEKGGAPVQERVIEIGRVIEVFRIGEFALTNEGQVTAGQCALYLTDERIYRNVPSLRAVERDTGSAIVRRDPLETRHDFIRPGLPDAEPPGARVRAGDESSMARFIEDDIRVDLERALHGQARVRYARALDTCVQAPTPSGNLYTGEGWNLTGRLTVIAKASLAMPVSYASGMLEVNFFPGFSREHWATLHIRARGRPNEGYSFQVDFEIMGW